MHIEIRPGTIAEILELYPQIPEFDQPHGREEYECRFAGARRHLLLIAYDGDRPVGFKAGYERSSDGSFYSWMGGVATAYRRYGVARQLSEAMERWALAQGYHTLRFTTRNRHRAMLQFALSNGFMITGVQPRKTLPEYRIYLEKKLG